MQDLIIQLFVDLCISFHCFFCRWCLLICVILSRQHGFAKRASQSSCLGIWNFRCNCHLCTGGRCSYHFSNIWTNWQRCLVRCSKTSKVRLQLFANYIISTIFFDHFCMVLLQLGHANLLLAIFHQFHWSALFHRFFKAFLSTSLTAINVMQIIITIYGINKFFKTSMLSR